ncbi:hypothetical protein TNCV_3348651 [Trichonephila clavipes]|nr:hypothetical protein TNCV_3348651 [Trichonephila clavipes]
MIFFWPWEPCGQGIESWMACNEFEPSNTKDPPSTVLKSKFQITKCTNKENHITDEANIKATPRTARTFKDILTVFRKHAKKPTSHLLLLA